ncbi:MAG TPA: hypothetical protein VIH61_04645 [Waddliaceae bacterium]
MQKKEIKFKDSFNDEIGLGRNRSEISDDIVPGSRKEPPIIIEEEAVLEELGLGKNPPLRDIIEQDIKDDAN